VKARYLLELAWSLDRSAAEPLADRLPTRSVLLYKKARSHQARRCVESRAVGAVERFAGRRDYSLRAPGGSWVPRSASEGGASRTPPGSSEGCATESASRLPLFDFTAVAPDLALFPRGRGGAMDYAISSAPDSTLEYAPGKV